MEYFSARDFHLDTDLILIIQWFHFSIYTFQKEVEVDKALMKGGSFKLNMHPRDYFDENPYKTDKPLPPVRKATPTKEPTKPFRPSNPGKLVIFHF